jgi:hypothetical protein
MFSNGGPLGDIYLVVDHPREELADVQPIQDNLLFSFDKDSVKEYEDSFDLFWA